jgi:hypothetical protein
MESNQAVLMLIVYRAIAGVCGMIIIYWGYSLLHAGVRERQGAHKIDSNDRRATLVRFGPGVGFALFGFLILSLSIARGVQVEPVAAQGARSRDEASRDQAGEALSSKAASGDRDLPAPSVAPSPAKVPDDIEGILKKVASGRELAESETKVLADWLTRIHQDPMSPHDRLRKNKKAAPIPVPHPGEI